MQSWELGRDGGVGGGAERGSRSAASNRIPFKGTEKPDDPRAKWNEVRVEGPLSSGRFRTHVDKDGGLYSQSTHHHRNSALDVKVVSQQAVFLIFNTTKRPLDVSAALMLLREGGQACCHGNTHNTR